MPKDFIVYILLGAGDLFHIFSVRQFFTMFFPGRNTVLSLL